MTLEKLFLTVLEISVASVPVILLLLLVSPLLGKRYAPSLRCLLWLALAVRLILPFNMPFRHAFQIDPFPAAQPQSAQTGWFLPHPALILENESETKSDKPEPLPEQQRNIQKSIKIAPVTLLAVVWASGVAIFLLYHVGAYFHTLRRLRRWSAPANDEETPEKLASVKRELSIRGEVGLYRSSRAASPLLVGFIRPRVILPEKPLAPEQLDFMLRHELWHLKRGDLWRKLLMLFANAIHWFNPLVWLMDRRANLDTELACDADVLRGADNHARKEYGYAVLSFMEQGWRCRTPLTSRFYGGKKQMKQRFYNIADTSAKKRGAALFCAAAIIIALTGCAVNMADPDMEPDGQAIPTAEKAKNTVQINVPLPDTNSEILIRARIDDISVAEETLNPADIDSDSWSPTIETDKTGEVLVKVYVNRRLYWHVVVDADANKQLSAYSAPSFQLADSAQERSRDIIDVIHDNLEWSKDPYIGGEMAWPLPGSTRIIQPFGESPQIPDDIHTGLDIAGEHGKPIIAANDGIVKKVSAEYTPGVGYGMFAIIDHGGEISTLYAHCSKILVSEGDKVVKGQKIAEAGATGFASESHLHFEVRVSGKGVDPMPYITSNGFMWPASGGKVITVFKAYPGHTGIDIGGIAEGSPVYAAASGTVVKAQDTNVGYGKHIIIDHGNGFQTLYAHNSELYVSVGDVVAQGQTIAAAGRSGNTTGHALHFEIRQDGKVLNPEPFLTAPNSPVIPQDDAERTVPVDDPGAPVYGAAGGTRIIDINGESVILAPAK